MRVIAGEAKGFHLKGPPSRATRPMNDKIKGSLFSMLAALDVAPARVLDLYAGTGSIGIEALSRGAEHADFVEQSAAACAVIRANLAHTKLADRAQVFQLPVATFLSRPQQPYDLIILDPPYADPAITPTLEQIGRSTLLQSDSVVAIGHSPRVSLPDDPGRLTRLRHRCHGDSCVSIYAVEDQQDEGNAE